MKLLRYSPILLAVCTALAVPLAVQATSELAITYDTPSFQNQELTAGNIRVSVSYAARDAAAVEDIENLSYQIYYDGVLQVDRAESTYSQSSVQLKDLDNNGTAEVIVSTYTGGAHCCTAFSIYDWQGSEFHAAKTHLLDAGGGSFKDLNDDGTLEFSSADNAFFYSFSSYAGSFPPSLILSFEEGQFVDSTQRFEPYLRSVAWEMYQAVQRAESEDYDANGILAGYVAQKILLGEYQQGWEFMLAHYDPTSDWGLDIYDEEGNVVDRYPDYPTALRAFLTKLNYLTATGQPNPHLDRLDRIIDSQ